MSNPFTDLAVREPVPPSGLVHHQPDGVVLIHPDTGEAVSVADAPMEWLVEYHAAIDEWVARARVARRLADGEIVRRMDVDNAHTVRAGALKATAPATGYTEHVDGERLWDLLQPFVDEGVISPQAAIDATGREEVREWRYKVHTGRVNGLRKRDPRISDAILSAVVREPKPRAVSVKRA